ncbi:rRNA (cytosine-C5-)-methyltransferase RCM1 [Aspergillus homomorphus CBS 101889]|uniref:S-adenosyl-L-methionine-dependent methyltransferase n=1 Tax=Aspergillus homomorphus (strain CBS 101889) TaxID=1450537 RepID=A0A395ICS8_ASPHC|nr:S-adenosyl-L-methionine-dependent methyltransferase [Aspergillus homomorphus CBS 101889]RAL16973.1 S-adenosyl-L-methionine-dependent methyltransferase [Aspergillus homomorphus CBS 101889]
MSLYYDAVGILTAPTTGGSFKSRIYNARTLKASPAQVYALIIEASKWDILLKEVIENAGILKLEPKLTPILALLLVHDHLLAKSGIAAKATHPLRQAIERHKTRLRAEFTKARVRRGCVSVDALREAVLCEKSGGGSGNVGAVYPRWVRINNVRTTLKQQLETTFKGYEVVHSLKELGTSVPKGRRLQQSQRQEGEGRKIYLDAHVPDLVAVAQGVDLTSTPAYKRGEIILQDKASCFPAYLLIGDGNWGGGDLLDGCAAPGNKTTHMASLLCRGLSEAGAGGRGAERKKRVWSMDQSQVRAKTLQKMVTTAGADSLVTVLPGQDFLALDPEDERFENVTGLLLDPSCSGSGILGRDDVPTLVLPEAPASGARAEKTQGKKRKRRQDDDPGREGTEGKKAASDDEEALATDENDLPANGHMGPERLQKLSNLQTRIVEHALHFPAATRVSYSTCSVHMVENEAVVARILASDVAKRRGWRIMRRDEQPEGMKKWRHRGVRSEKAGGAVAGVEVQPVGDLGLSDEVLEGCLRCWPGDDEGTGGFFIAGFVRDGDDEPVAEETSGHAEVHDEVDQDDEDQGDKDQSDAAQNDDDDDENDENDDEDEWGGFSD